jgi:signal transduction histidine kinase
MRLRSLRNKLALFFSGIVALALGLVFFLVVPQLRSNLEDQQLDDVERATRATAAQLERAQEQEIAADALNELVRGVADSAGAQVTLLGVQTSEGSDRVLFYSISDSRAQRLEELPEEPALEAMRTERVVRQVNRFDGEDSAQVAYPFPIQRRPAQQIGLGWVAVYTRSLEDVEATVGLIRRQVLVAGAVALLVALLGGYLVARRLARRVQRLERAAEQVAAGRFVDPVPVDSEDELGQLTQAFNEMQGKLARVDRARREFIANASHELRTPIFSLGGYVELLRDEDLDPAERGEFMQAIAEQLERLQKLTTDLLDLSRLDAGSLDLVTEEVDLGELASSVAREFIPAVDVHGSRLSLDLESGRVEAVCDPDRVAQIMRILLDNALRHTPPGTDVEISACRENGRVRLAVADSGPGLEESTRLHAFERFFTADSGSGSGLGLAIAKELAERMDGGITLSSGPGRTVFTLDLPVTPA